MSAYEFQIEVQSDFLEKIAKAKPVQALSELIWNSLDADANSVNVSAQYNEMNEMSCITIEDDGEGIPRAQAEKSFGKLGGSWKRPGGRTSTGRFLHGQEGRGRFKAFTLGARAEWNVRYRKEDGRVWEYRIWMSINNIKSVSILEESLSCSDKTGVSLQIFDLNREFRFMGNETSLDALLEIFAIYLSEYENLKISVDGAFLDYKSAIQDIKILNLKDAYVDGKSYPVRLKIVEWKKVSQKSLYLCGDHGIPIIQVGRKINVSGRQFAAYLQSTAFEKMQQSGFIDIAEMEPSVKAVIDEAQKEIKDYFRAQTAREAESLVSEWKKEKIYPFSGDPVSQIEQVERQVFDIVALNVATHLPDFSANSAISKSFQFRMIKQALEKSPEELRVILDEVLKLPKHAQEDLAALLKDVSLTAIISSAKIVADRLKFLNGLEAILFDEHPKKSLKERSQLHKILAQNTWIFGEEYTLSVDDRSLTEVLRAHRAKLDPDIKIDEPVKHISQTKGIVDLMLSKSIRRHSSQKLSHLVIELKRPSVKIGKTEINQIEEYAFSILADPRFLAVPAEWVFWVISDDLDSFAKNKVIDESGEIYTKDSTSIYVKTWAQVLEENRSRLQFFQENLEYQVDKGESMSFLSENYAPFLKGIIDDEDYIKECEVDSEG